MADRERTESPAAEEYSPTVSTATSSPQSEQSEESEESEQSVEEQSLATPPVPAQPVMGSPAPYVFMVDSPLLEQSVEEYAAPGLSTSVDQSTANFSSSETSAPADPMSEHSEQVDPPVVSSVPRYQYHRSTLPPLARAHPKQRGPRTTRDQRIEILLMRRLGHTYDQISKFLGISIASVTYTSQKKNPQPQHNLAGRRPRISEEEVDRLVEYVAKNKRDKKLTHTAIAKALWPDGDVSVETLKYNLHKRSVRLR